MVLVIPANALAIGSWLALIPAAGFGAVIVRRASMEDKFLKQNLAHYLGYMQRVPGGLFPRVRIENQKRNSAPALQSEK